ncbi:DUF4388 domain-containing protein [Deinococcus cavernae]|uniref:DUF4388 domain-containing protein n=1 Tax=Deinococcus cavernae TaxID=2320857 RepID=A0A418V6U1_9DEIO|nr:DUF4388 domain-containing protein [Deinococcus cavernae]RJF71796.1 DUF4388 domain-containing protein [Deinococcus cavernae]
MPHTTSLEHFDFLQLLRMLADNRKTGLLTIYRPQGDFEAWLEQGLVRHLQLGHLQGVLALAALLNDPQGRFHFDEGRTHPSPALKQTVDSLALEAMASLPEQDMPFAGPARMTDAERLDAMDWTDEERHVLRQIEQQVPVSDLWSQPLARGLISRLLRLGLLKERRSRVARLVVAVTHEVRGVALIDDLIFRRWKEDLVRHPQVLALRDEAGHIYQFPLRSGPNLGTQLVLPPDLIMQTRLRAGDSVLVKPV